MKDILPKPEWVFREASTAADKLKNWPAELAGTTFGPEDLPQLQSDLEKKAADESGLGWDPSEQACLALWALADADPGRLATASPRAKASYEQRKQYVRDLAHRLAFPSEYQSPQNFPASLKETAPKKR